MNEMAAWLKPGRILYCLRIFSGSPRVLCGENLMNSEKAIELEGLGNASLALAHISGKMRKRFIRLTLGDRVRMQMSPYDIAKARFVYSL